AAQEKSGQVILPQIDSRSAGTWRGIRRALQLNVAFPKIFEPQLRRARCNRVGINRDNLAVGTPSEAINSAPASVPSVALSTLLGRPSMVSHIRCSASSTNERPD